MKIFIRIFSILILIFSIFGSAYAQQRPVYSQYMFNGLAINPAYAGNQKQLSAMALLRKQWVNFEGAPTIQSLGIHSGFEKRKIGAGLQISNDRIGVHNDLSVYGSYAYQIELPKGTLALGLQAGFNNLKSDFTKPNARNANDPLLNNVYSNFNPNFGSGLFYSNSHSYVGFSVPFIINNRVFQRGEIYAVSTEERYYFLTGGKLIDIDKKLKIRPSFLLRIQEGAPVGYDLNTNFILDDIITLGASYRSGDAAVLLFAVQANENFGFGYAYDWTLSSLHPHTRGSHEIMVSYRVKLTSKPCHTYF